MNFTQLHDRLRQELLRRLQRGTVSVSLLARQTGLAPAHISNYLNGRRHLSLASLDLVLLAQQLTVADLLPQGRASSHDSSREERCWIPLVSAATALFESVIHASATQERLPVPARLLAELRTRCTPARRRWERFVAVRISPADSLPMTPLLLPGCTVLIDRHYTSLLPYRSGRQNLYAIRHGNRLLIRHADFQCNCLVLRPNSPESAVELLELAPQARPAEWIAGRVALICNEF